MNKPDEQKKGSLKKPILLITYAILLFLLLLRFEAVWGTVKWLLNAVGALLVGAALAFLFHLPMDFFQYKVLKFMEHSKFRMVRKLWRVSSMVLAYLCVIGFVYGIVALILPRFMDSLVMLATNFSGYLNSFQSWADGVLSSLSISPDMSEVITDIWAQAIAFIQSLLGKAISGAFDFTVSFTTGLFQFLLAFMLSAFVLYYRNNVFPQMRRLTTALIGRKRTDRICDVLQLSNNIFSKFIFGQLTEALILGVLCFIGMTVFGMDYALLISTIIAVTAIIPILGAYIGTIPCALILLVIDPLQAFWFVVFIIVLQQIEGNLIYPHVVGNAIGLSGLWVLVSLIVGGGLFGIWGMLLGTPLFAVCYHLVGQWLKQSPRELE